MWENDSIINAPWVGTALGVLGIAFALYQIFKSRGARLYYQFIGQNILNGGSNDVPGGLEVVYENKKLQNLSLSQIILWNGGSASVRGDDLIDSDPLSIKFGDDAEIVKFSIEKFTRKAISPNLLLSEDQVSILIGFEFLDQNDGFLIKVWHTAINSKPIVSGTVVGVPTGLQSLGRIPPRYSRKTVKERSVSDPLSHSLMLMSSIMLYSKFAPIAAMVIGVAGCGAMGYEYLTEEHIFDGSRIPLAIFTGIYLFSGIFGIWVFRRRFPSILTPEELGG